MGYGRWGGGGEYGKGGGSKKECGRQVNSASVTVLGELDALHDQLNRLVVPENLLSLKCVQGSRDRVAPTDAEICLRLECAGIGEAHAHTCTPSSPFSRPGRLSAPAPT